MFGNSRLHGSSELYISGKMLGAMEAATSTKGCSLLFSPPGTVVRRTAAFMNALILEPPHPKTNIPHTTQFYIERSH